MTNGKGAEPVSLILCCSSIFLHILAYLAAFQGLPNRNLAMQDFLVLWQLCQLPSVTENCVTNFM